MGQEEEHDDFFDDFDDFEDIDEDEKEALQRDLLDVRTLKRVLGSRGIKGVVVFCPDCEIDHFLGWDLLAGNLEQMLDEGDPPVHEPAWDPNPNEYVTWDYARGFLDGFETDPGEEIRGKRCGYCGTKLSQDGRAALFCPACGANQATYKLILKLRSEGWEEERIEELLEATGFELPLYDPARDEGEGGEDR